MGKEKHSLLVVDSSATYLFFMGMLLKKLEYAVRTSTTAEESLQAMAEHLPSLVITDVVLPKMNGVDLLKRIKQDSRLKDVPVIIHTAVTDQAVKEACGKAGSAGYFIKPADPDSLYKVIQAAIEFTPRQYIRIDTFLRVEVGGEVAAGGVVRTEYVTTLSEGGLYLKSLCPEPVNTVLSLRIFIKDREVTVKAVVLYSSIKTGGQHKVPGMGMKFVSISPEDRAYVHDFVKEQVTQGLSV